MIKKHNLGRGKRDKEGIKSWSDQKFSANLAGRYLLFVEFLSPGITYDYTVTGLVGKSPLSLPRGMLQYADRKGDFVTLFLPGGAEVSTITNGLSIKGRTHDRGHNAFLELRSRVAATKVVPLLANPNAYPDNRVCGFRVEMGDNRLVILHHDPGFAYKGCERVPNQVISILEFCGDDLFAAWNYSCR